MLYNLCYHAYRLKLEFRITAISFCNHLKTYLHSSKQWVRYCMDVILKKDVAGEGMLPYAASESESHLCATVGASQAGCNIFSINTNTPCTHTIFFVHTQHTDTPMVLNES